jgi:hypothetical protein
VGTFSAGQLIDRPNLRLPAYLQGYQLPLEGRIIATVPLLYAAFLRGRRANRCVDACRTLHYAYAQLGLRSQLRAVDLTVCDSTGRVVMHGSPVPSWEGNVLDGHAVLCLPDVQRFVDATVEQCREIARYKIGPVCGRAVAQIGGRVDPNDPFPPDLQLEVQRGDLELLYTVGDEQATQTILRHPWVQDHVHEHRLTGVNLATAALEVIRGLPSPILAEIRKESQLRRVQGLLDVMGDAPIYADSYGDWSIAVPGSGTVRLDELPLPPDVPPAAWEDPGLHPSS